MAHRWRGYPLFEFRVYHQMLHNKLKIYDGVNIFLRTKMQIIEHGEFRCQGTISLALPYSRDLFFLIMYSPPSPGIRINAINPTLTRTRIFRDCPFNFLESSLGQFCADSHPLHGRLSKPEEQGEVILFLASDAARFVSGECVKVDAALAKRGYPKNYYPGPPPCWYVYRHPVPVMTPAFKRAS